jgi:curved DNA-binding protein CbpA
MRQLHTHYENLKVARNAPPEVIKAAYRVLAQRYHPDVNRAPDAARVMKLINEAWAVLGDPVAKQRYDEWIEDQLIAEALEEAAAPPNAKRTGPSDTRPPPSADPSRPQQGESHSQSAPLIRLNAWLGTPRGTKLALGSIVGGAALAWFWLTSSPTPSSRPLPQVERVQPSAHRSAEPTPRTFSFEEALSGPQPSARQATEAMSRISRPVAANDIAWLFRGKEFDLQGARSAGLDDDQIADALASRANFDVQGARRAGYTSAQIIPLLMSRLRGERSPPAVVTPAQTRWSPNGKPWPAVAAYLDGMPKRAFGGLSKLTVDNTNGGSDVHIKLCTFQVDPCTGLRNAFVPQGSSFTMNNVVSGTYDLRYRDLSSGRIAKSEEIRLRQVEIENSTRFSVFRITLYQVAGGNTNFTTVPEQQF